ADTHGTRAHRCDGELDGGVADAELGRCGEEWDRVGEMGGEEGAGAGGAEALEGVAAGDGLGHAVGRSCAGGWIKYPIGENMRGMREMATATGRERDGTAASARG